MPEYRAPGVYIEETSFRSRAIQGVATSVTAFVGPTLSEPDAPPTEPLTGFRDFEEQYGGLGALRIAGVVTPNHVAHAARAFFAEGGSRLYIGRVAIPDDGRALAVADYEAALDALDDRDDVSLVAAPGASADAALGPAVMRLLADHAERHPARFAVLDSVRGQSIDAVRKLRQAFDTSRAALYFPWVLADDPLRARWWWRRTIALPPSGFLCGIYARIDATRGVFKAPAGEPIKTARGFERRITQGEQEILNPEGINCLRTFAGRGHLVWGARTVSSDPEWKYVAVRRYFTYLERSIERGTQWAVFEPNGEALWNAVRQAVETFLYTEWRSGALHGATPGQAFFVRCDRTTMTQNDLDQRRLICEIGVAPLKPAEFVIFRIAQLTDVQG